MSCGRIVGKSNVVIDIKATKLLILLIGNRMVKLRLRTWEANALPLSYSRSSSMLRDTNHTTLEYQYEINRSHFGHWNRSKSHCEVIIGSISSLLWEY